MILINNLLHSHIIKALDLREKRIVDVIEPLADNQERSRILDQRENFFLQGKIVDLEGLTRSTAVHAHRPTSEHLFYSFFFSSPT